MALITFDPLFKYSTTLSNGNLTASVPSYNSCARATEGKTSGKWYWEIKYVSGSHPMIGVSAKSAIASSSVWTDNLNLGRFYYYNGTRYPGSAPYSSAMTVGDIIGVAIDLDSPSKTIKFYRNGIPLGVAFSDLHLLEQPVYPFCIVGGSFAATFTANFGATDFDIVTRNSSEWEKLLFDGYLPYITPDILIYTDKLNILNLNEKINLTLDKIIQYHPASTIESIKITINDKIIHDGQVMLPLPNNIVLQLNSSFITQSVNPMKIYANGNILVKTLNIYHETSLLNPLVRDFKNTKVDNMKLSIDTGTSLNNVLEGNVLLNIPTEMRSKVNKITVDGDVDKILNANGKYQLSNIEQYLYKTPIVLNSGNRLVSTDYLGIQNILYMKAPAELPTDFTMTDGNESTSRYTRQGTFTFNLYKPYTIISNRIYTTSTNGYNVGNTLKLRYYDINNNLLHETVASSYRSSYNATVYHSDIKGVVKIIGVFESRNSMGDWSEGNIYSIVANGYPDNISNLYYTQKYYMYSRLGYFVSRFILEYTFSPIDSTLVKSKKMGNLAFINNSSKVVIKKYDSSIDNPSSKIVRSKIVLSNKIPIRRIEIK